MTKLINKNSGSRTAGHLAVGRFGEDLAVEYLTNRGYTVIGRNIKTRFGELDIVFLDGETLVFAEVKSRSSNLFNRPDQLVGAKKRRLVSRAAYNYALKMGWEDRSARFDILSVEFSGPRPLIEHLIDAFDLEI